MTGLSGIKVMTNDSSVSVAAGIDATLLGSERQVNVAGWPPDWLVCVSESR